MLWVMRSYEPLKTQGYGLAEISISSRLQEADILFRQVQEHDAQKD